MKLYAQKRGQVIMLESTEHTLKAHFSDHTAASVQLPGSASSSRCQLCSDGRDWWSASRANLLEVVLHVGLLELTCERYLKLGGWSYTV